MSSCSNIANPVIVAKCSLPGKKPSTASSTLYENDLNVQVESSWMAFGEMMGSAGALLSCCCLYNYLSMGTRYRCSRGTA